MRWRRKLWQLTLSVFKYLFLLRSHFGGVRIPLRDPNGTAYSSSQPDQLLPEVLALQHPNEGVGDRFDALENILPRL